jgi:hypothetical protein
MFDLNQFFEGKDDYFKHLIFSKIPNYSMPVQPKSSHSSYMIFALIARKKIKDEFPGTTLSEGSKIISSIWKELSPHQKKVNFLTL